MEDTPIILIAFLVLLSVVHTGLASYLLIRNAYRIANWQIRPHKALIGQFAVLVFASALAAGFVAASLFVSSIFHIGGLIFATPILFFLLYWIGQDRLIIHLSTFRGRRNLRKFLRRRIGYLTSLPTLVMCLGLVATGFIYFAVKPAPPDEKPIREVSAAPSLDFWPGKHVSAHIPLFVRVGPEQADFPS